MPATTWDLMPRCPETKDGASEVKKPNTANPTKAIMAAAPYCPRAAAGTTATIMCGDAKPTAPPSIVPYVIPPMARTAVVCPTQPTHHKPRTERPPPREHRPRPMRNVEIFYHRFGSAELAKIGMINEMPGKSALSGVITLESIQ